jgi:hypothetical protein
VALQGLAGGPVCAGDRKADILYAPRKIFGEVEVGETLGTWSIEMVSTL